MAIKNTKTVELPEGVNFTAEGATVKIKGPKGELSKEFNFPGVSVTSESNSVTIKINGTAKKQKAIVGTYESHLKNMIKGVTEGFTSEMKAVFAHFPITIKQEGNIIEIQNFLGEKVPRKAKVVGDVQVKIQKDLVTIEGNNKEDVGQTTANIELATRVKNKDVRIFQDGVYVTKKP